MVGIIILNYNSHPEVVQCVESIEMAISTKYFVYIIDNCSTDDSYNILREYYSKSSLIKILSTSKNIGYARGNNYGAKLAIANGADKILIVNTDIIFNPRSIDYLIKCLSNEISIVGPCILDKKGNKTQFASKLLTFKGYLINKKPLCYIFSHKKDMRFYNIRNLDTNYVFSGMCSGCCFLIDANVFEKINFFDENTFLFYEEDILAYKLSVENKLTMICNESTVVHFHSSSVKKKGNAFIRYHRFLSSLYVLRYYTNLNDAKFFIASLLNIIPFYTNALFNREYRKLGKSFINIIFVYFRKEPQSSLKCQIL